MDLHAALHQQCGCREFRPGQEAAVRAALEGRDSLVVMPTGAGKSLCYQLPGLVGEGLTLVVSPLVSLMQDQVAGLERAAPGRAALVNAQQDAETNRRAVERAVAGEVRLLYIAPERFSARGFFEQLCEAPIGLFVVDEAHCVSQWGHDFRPDYFRLADAARALGTRAIMASTATATPQVAADIARRLGLRDPVKVKTGFDRPNLTFAVAPCRSTGDKHARIATALAEPEARPGIVYAGTRARAEALAGALTGALGLDVLPYHAGLDRALRAETQRRFMDGEGDGVVATTAFGMGVDKADVRTVCHESVPGSLEAYYQEAGRAGRDGGPARALLFATGRDKGLHVFFIERAAVSEDLLKRIGRTISAAAEGDPPRYHVELAALARGEEEEAVRAVVGHLAQAGVIQPAPSAPDRVAGRLIGEWDARSLGVCRSAAQEGTRVRWRQYRSVWAWVEGSKCRREGILRHFGDKAAPAPLGPCCDVCDPSVVPAAPADAPRQRALGTAEAGDLDGAILDVVVAAQPGVGRTRAVEILRGGRSKVVQKYSYDGLPHYGTFSHLRNEDVLARVDALLSAGTLRSTGGRFPKLEVV